MFARAPSTVWRAERESERGRHQERGLGRLSTCMGRDTHACRRTVVQVSCFVCGMMAWEEGGAALWCFEFSRIICTITCRPPSPCPPFFDVPTCVDRYMCSRSYVPWRVGHLPALSRLSAGIVGGVAARPLVRCCSTAADEEFSAMQ